MDDEEELKAEIEARLGRPVDDLVWSAARGEGRVEDALVTPRWFGPLLEYVRDGQARLSGRARRKVASHAQDRPLFSEEEQLRATALYEYFAKLAAATPAVRDFRRQVLGGQLMTDEQAWEWLRSDGVAQCPLGAFVDHGLSPTRDLGRIVDNRALRERDGTPWERVTVRFEPSGDEWTKKRPSRHRKDVRLLAYPDRKGSVAQVGVVGHSVLDDLRWVVQQLMGRSPWEEHEATWFVLTGVAPRWWPVRRSERVMGGQDFEYRTLTLTVEPWVSAQTVLAAYRDAQRKMLGGRDNRPLSAKNLGLFRFCVARMGEDGQLPAWPTLLREWNEAHPDDRYENARAIERVYKRMLGYVAFPDYDDPW